MQMAKLHHELLRPPANHRAGVSRFRRGAEGMATPCEIVRDAIFLCSVPPEYGRVTALRAENGCVVASTESGVDYLIPTETVPPDVLEN
jgi:hypothetical protein